MGTHEGRFTNSTNTRNANDFSSAADVDWNDGNLIIVSIFADTALDPFTSCTDNSGDSVSWTSLGSAESTLARVAVKCYAKVAVSNETNRTITVGIGDTCAKVMIVEVYDGYDLSDLTGHVVDTDGTNFTDNQLNLSGTGTSGYLAHMALGADASNSFSGYSEFTESTGEVQETNVTGCTAYDLGFDGSLSENIDCTGSAHQVGIVIELAPAIGQQIQPTGHDAAATFGQVVLGPIRPTGLDASVTFGAPIVSPQQIPSVGDPALGFSAAATFGTPLLDPQQIPGIGDDPLGLDASVTFGTVRELGQVISNARLLVGLDASVSFGAPGVNQSVSASGFSAAPTFGTVGVGSSISFQPSGLLAKASFGDAFPKAGPVNILMTGFSTAASFGSPNTRITAHLDIQYIWDTKEAVGKDLGIIWSNKVTVGRSFVTYWNVDPAEGFAVKDLGIVWSTRTELSETPSIKDIPTDTIKRAVTAPFTKILRRVEILEPDGVNSYYYDVPVSQGSVTVAADADSRRTARLTVDAADARLQIAPTKFWYDKIIKVYRGIDAGSEIWWDTLGTFTIDNIGRPNFPGTISLALRDKSKILAQTQLPTAENYQKNQPIENIITKIAVDGGIGTLSMPLTGTSTDRDWMFEAGTVRWAAMRDIARAYAYDLYFDRHGVLVLEPGPDPQNDPVSYVFQTGHASNISSFTKTTDDAQLKNHIVVVGEAEDKTPIWAEAENANVNSPTNVYPYPVGIGRRTQVIKDPLVGNTQQAQDLADQTLRVSALEHFDVPMEVIPITWLEANDVVSFLDPDPVNNDPTRYLLTNMEINLLAEGPMSIKTKRVVEVT